MCFKLWLFLALYCLLVYQILHSQKKFIQSHCQIVEQQYQNSQNSKNENNPVILDCIACTEMQMYPPIAFLKNIQSGFIQFNNLKQMEQQSLQKQKILTGFLYLQKQCFQYQCQQLQFLNDFQSVYHKANLSMLGFQQQYGMQNHRMRNCQTFNSHFFGYLSKQKEKDCYQFPKQISNQLNNQQVYSLMLRYRYLVHSQQNQKQNGKYQIQPPSIYFVYSSYGFQTSLIFFIVAALTIFQSKDFFQEVLDNVCLFSLSKNHLTKVSLIITGISLLLFWDNEYFNMIVNACCIYFVIKIILKITSVDQLFVKLFSYSFGALWIFWSLMFRDFLIEIHMTVGIILSVLQLFFWVIHNKQLRVKVMIILNVSIIMVSILMFHKISNLEISLRFSGNIPFIQLILLIASYPKKNEFIEVRKGTAFPEHAELQDLQLRMSKQLGV